jgi:hypothetical protein
MTPTPASRARAAIARPHAPAAVLAGLLAGLVFAGPRGLAASEDPIIPVTLDTIRAKIPKIGGLPKNSMSPSPVLTDFFGIVRLADDLTPEVVRRDFVPAFAREAPGSAARVLRLQWNDGGALDFYFGAGISIDGKPPGPMRVNAAVVEHALAPENDGPEVARFMAFLETQGWSARYLKANPYYAAEKVAFARMNDPVKASAAAARAGIEAFAKERNAVYILPDAVHGDAARYEVLLELLKGGQYDWFALEMITEDLQPAIDAWVAATPGTAEHQAAEARLLAFFGYAWNDKFGPPGAPADNHYFRAMRIARDAGKLVYALDTTPEQIFFRYGEFPLGATTRNVVWVDRIPKTGRGIVFGGSAHAVIGQKGTFQDLLALARPDTTIYHYYVDHPPQKPGAAPKE